MKHKSRKHGAMVVKVDLEKAYDWIQWNFLEKFIKAVGFSPSIWKLIMFCVASTNLTLLWNGEKLEPITM